AHPTDVRHVLLPFRAADTIPGWRCPAWAVLQGMSPSMLLLRDVQKTDLSHLKRLAAVLNTVNLPNDQETLGRLIHVAVRSFAGRVKDPFEREFLFVLEEPRTGAVIGTSMVIAQHGTFDAPHIYYEVSEREHYSASLDRHFRHKVLSIAYNYEGPTEIG